MLKTLRLRNLIMAGQVTGDQLEELLQRRDYEGAFCDLRNDERWMDDMTQSPVALETICGSPTAVVLLCNNVMSASKFGTIRDFADAALLDSNAMDPLLSIAGIPTIFYDSLDLRAALFDSSAGRGAVWSSATALSELAENSALISWFTSTNKRRSTSISSTDTAVKVAGKSIIMQAQTYSSYSNMSITLGVLGGGSGSGNHTVTLTYGTIALDIKAYTDLRMVGISNSGISVTLYYVDMN